MELTFIPREHRGGHSLGVEDILFPAGGRLDWDLG